MANEPTDEQMASDWDASVGKPAGAENAWEADKPSGSGGAPAVAAVEQPQSIAAATVGSERILNQDEIDSLLGFSLEEENGAR